MKIITSLLICGLLAGCATTSPPVAGTKGWYEVRMQEIESAYQLGEITKDQYLELKSETDKIRSDYNAKIQSRLTYKSQYRHYPMGYHRHRYHRHR